MRRHTFPAAVVAVALVLSMPATSASASDDGPTWLGCAGQPGTTTGTLAGYHPGVFRDEMWRGDVVGTIRPCRPPVASDVFAIALYDSHGTATAVAMPYPQSLEYSVPVDVPSKTTAICLIDNQKSRLDCLKLGWAEQQNGPPQPLANGNLPIDSPLVTAVPEVTLGGRTVHPGCPTCVQG